MRIDGEILETSVGRVIFNEALPEELPYDNKGFDKNALKDMVSHVFIHLGTPKAAKLADDIKDLGFRYATKSGVSISAYDLITPPNKDIIVEKATTIVNKLNEQFHFGFIDG